MLKKVATVIILVPSVKAARSDFYSAFFGDQNPSMLSPRLWLEIKINNFLGTFHVSYWFSIKQIGVDHFIRKLSINKLCIVISDIFVTIQPCNIKNIKRDISSLISRFIFFMLYGV